VTAHDFNAIALALRWSDIDWGNSVVRITKSFTCGEETSTKTRGSVRDVVLSPPAFKALELQKPYTFEFTQHIFHNPINNKPWLSDKAIRESFWIPALEKAGVDYRNPYQTRHTYASTMLSVGEYPIWISLQMGHTNTNMLFSVMRAGYLTGSLMLVIKFVIFGHKMVTLRC